MQVHYNLLNGRAPDRSRALLTVAPASAGLDAAADHAPPGAGRARRARRASTGGCATATRRSSSSRGSTDRGRVRPGRAPHPVPRERRRTRRRARSRRAIGASPTPTTIHVAAGHMHLLGASIRLELNPGTPRARVLLDIPRWDFHWQNAYTLAQPVKAEPGDVVRVTCRHDVRKRMHGGARRPDDAALHPLGRGDDRRDVPRDPPGHARVALLRILLVSQMYPGPDDPDLGVFVANLERELVARGHELERAVVDRRAGDGGGTCARSATRSAPLGGSGPTSSTRTSSSRRASWRRSRRARRWSSRPTDRTSRTSASMPGVRAATRYVVRRAAAVVAVSRLARASSSRTRTRGAPGRPRSSTAESTSSASHRATPTRRAREVGWIARRHGVSLPRRAHGAQERPPSRARVRARGEGTLAFVGDGPLRGALEGRGRIRARRPRRPRRRARLDRSVPTSSASRASSSRSGSRRSRRWPPRARSSRPTSVARRSS